MSGVGGSVTYDNILVQEIESDRSVNGGAGVGANGLQVFGNGITRTPVATGADLVAYGGFTLASYLVQPATSTMINWSNPWISHFWFDTVGKISIENQNSSGYNNTVLLVSEPPQHLYTCTCLLVYLRHLTHATRSASSAKTHPPHSYTLA